MGHRWPSVQMSDHATATARPYPFPHTLHNPSLSQLPPSYLAEVLAHAQLGQPEPGFEGAPGMLYLASELYRQVRGCSGSV